MSLCLAVERIWIEATVASIQGSAILTSSLVKQILRPINFSVRETVPTHAVTIVRTYLALILSLHLDVKPASVARLRSHVV
jgi:hypothetical protein